MKIKPASQVKVGEYVLLGNYFLKIVQIESSEKYYSCDDVAAVCLMTPLPKRYVFLHTDLLLVAEEAEVGE